RPSLRGVLGDLPSQAVHPQQMHGLAFSSPLPRVIRRRKVLVEPVAPPGRCPEEERGGSCTRALPPSRRNHRPSTQELRTFATPSCQDFRRSTGVSAFRCWPTSGPAGA